MKILKCLTDNGYSIIDSYLINKNVIVHNIEEALTYSIDCEKNGRSIEVNGIIGGDIWIHSLIDDDDCPIRVKTIEELDKTLKEYDNGN